MTDQAQSACRMTMSATGRVAAAVVLLLCGLGTATHAQRLGVQVSVEPFAIGGGPRIEIPIGGSGRFATTFLATSLDVMTAPDCHPDACIGVDVNANVGWPLLRSGRGPYVGAGLGVRTMPGDPEPVLNLLAGVRNDVVFGEARINNETVLLTVGVLFGRRRAGTRGT